MLIEQANFEEYLRIRGIYFEKNGKHRVSAEFRKDMIEIIRLENSDKEECTEYLARRFKEKFDMDLQYVSVSFLSENITQFMNCVYKKNKLFSKTNKKLNLQITIIIAILAVEVVVVVEAMVVVTAAIDTTLVTKVVHIQAVQVQEAIIVIKVAIVQKTLRIKRKE